MGKEVEYQFAGSGKEAAAEQESASAKMLEEIASAMKAGAQAGGAAGDRAAGEKDRSQETIDKAKIKDWLDNSEFKKLSPETLLSRTERLILNNLDNAVKQGDVKAVQEMLATLAENPESVKSVLNALKWRLEKGHPLRSVEWETGTDSNGRSFVRLHIYQRNDFSKSSGGTEVTIGSDGRNSATYRERWNSSPVALDAQSALRKVMADNGFIIGPIDNGRPEKERSPFALPPQQVPADGHKRRQ